MKNLYFQRANGTYLRIKSDVKEDEVIREINEFLERHNFKSYYTRYWTENGITTYDVGSWTEFFVYAPAELLNANKIVGTEQDFIERV
jgi:hypothetical protein